MYAQGAGRPTFELFSVLLAGSICQSSKQSRKNGNVHDIHSAHGQLKISRRGQLGIVLLQRAEKLSLKYMYTAATQTRPVQSRESVFDTELYVSMVSVQWLAVQTRSRACPGPWRERNRIIPRYSTGRFDDASLAFADYSDGTNAPLCRRVATKELRQLKCANKELQTTEE